jgi:leucyl-tRNA synthetase
MYNYLIKEVNKPMDSKNLEENYEKLLILLIPFIPHFANECLESITKEQPKWPDVSKKHLIEDKINFVVQINGKKRALLSINRDTSEKALLKEILENNDELEKFLKNQSIKKTIFVSNRLINIIL